MNEKQGTVLTILMTALWGTSFAFTDIVLDCGVSPFQVLAIRFIISALLLCAIFARSLKQFTKDELFIGLKSGLALFFGMALQVFAIKHTSSSNAAFLTMLYVVFVPLISAVFFKNQLQKNIMFSVVLAVIGTALVSLQNGFTAFKLGDFLAIGCSIFIALQMIFLDEKEKKFDSIRVTIIEMGVVGILGLIFIPIYGGGIAGFALPKASLLPLAYLTLIPGCLCFALQTVCQKHLPVARVSILFTFECIFATITNVLLLHETISFIQIIGFIAIFMATLVIVIPNKIKK